MSYTGRIVDGQVVFDDPLPLPNGTAVRVEPVAPDAASTNGPAEQPAAGKATTLAQRLSKFLKNDVDLPSDAAAQHDHYLYGTPKK